VCADQVKKLLAEGLEAQLLSSYRSNLEFVPLPEPAGGAGSSSPAPALALAITPAPAADEGSKGGIVRSGAAPGSAARRLLTPEQQTRHCTTC
jgi:hypothetical protein